MVVQSQLRQIVPWDPILKKPSQNMAGGVAQGAGPEFKPWYRKNKQTNQQESLVSRAVICYFMQI
jgi:hypothetical protein